MMPMFLFPQKYKKSFLSLCEYWGNTSTVHIFREVAILVVRVVWDAPSISVAVGIVLIEQTHTLS